MPPAPLAMAARRTAHTPDLSLAIWSKERAAILLLMPPLSQAGDESLVQAGPNHSTLVPNSSDHSNVGNAHKPNQGSQSPSWNFPSGERKESEKRFSPDSKGDCQDVGWKLPLLNVLVKWRSQLKRRKP